MPFVGSRESSQVFGLSNSNSHVYGVYDRESHSVEAAIRSSGSAVSVDSDVSCRHHPVTGRSHVHNSAYSGIR